MLHRRDDRKISVVRKQSILDEISLTQALDADTIRSYQQKSTGRKFLINPALG